MSRAPEVQPAGLRSTLVSPGDSGGLRARLVRAADGDAPFAVVHEGRFARILIAELVGENGVAQSRFAWKLRVDVVGSLGDGKPAPGNAEQDRAWRLERAELLRVRSPHVVAPVAVPPALTASPPVFYCRRIDDYFHPVCPTSRAVLRVCRDDAVLAAAGLPGYADDTVRYLYCGSPQPGTEQQPKTFYRAGAEPSPTGLKGGARVAGQQQLVRDWAKLVHGERPVDELPCCRCVHRDECYPRGDDGDAEREVIPAEQHLHAVSFYDVDSIAMELAVTDFDDAIVRLGGGLATPGERTWMAAGEARQVTLEALRLKLSAFADACRGVLALHEAGRPYLGLSPANLVALGGAGSSAVPANWRLRLALTDLGGATPVTVPGSGDALWQPGREVVEDPSSRLFVSPLLRTLEGGSVTMSVSCTDVGAADTWTGETVVAGSPPRRVVQVHRAGVPSFVMPGDLLVVQPVDGGAAASARVDEVSSKGLTATVLPGEAAAGAEWSGGAFDARLSFLRHSGPSADLYALGMLLLRILLVHDEQTLEDVAGAVERCLGQLSTGSLESAMPIEDRWQELLDGELGEGRFASWHVMHRRDDRQAIFDAELKSVSIVPASLWRTLLAIAGRLLLASPIARGDGGGRSPVVPLLREIELLERRLHVELFGAQARDRTLARICRQQLVALHADPVDDAGVGDGNGAASSGFVLAVGRVGEATIRHYHFDTDRVTIGRRDDDNDLQLPDPMVSSRHAVIEWSDGEFTLFDRGSTNGTEVDGIRLPVEVPHPLDDGSVIHIRPFMLSFRRAGSHAQQTMGLPAVDVAELHEQLVLAYVENVDRGRPELHAALTAELDDVRGAKGRSALVGALEVLLRRLGPGAGGASAGPDDAEAGAGDEAALSAASLRALRELLRNLTGEDVDAGAGEEHVREFAGRLQHFVESTSRWIGDLLEFRHMFGQQLDLRATQTGAGRPPLRTAAEVRRELLVPTGQADAAAASHHFLSRFFDDVLAILEDLLAGNQRVRQAVRSQLAPEGLVAAARHEPGASDEQLQQAADSVLWKVYQDAFARMTRGDSHEQELGRLLEMAAARRAGR